MVASIISLFIIVETLRFLHVSFPNFRCMCDLKATVNHCGRRHNGVIMTYIVALIVAFYSPLKITKGLMVYSRLYSTNDKTCSTK